MKRLVGLLVLGMVIGVVGGCKKSAKEKLIGKWQFSPDGAIAEVLPDGTVTSNGKVIGRYEILEDGRLKTWSPTVFPRRWDIYTIAFIEDTLVVRLNQVDSSYVKIFERPKFDTTFVRKMVRAK